MRSYLAAALSLAGIALAGCGSTAQPESDPPIVFISASESLTRPGLIEDMLLTTRVPSSCYVAQPAVFETPDGLDATPETLVLTLPIVNQDALCAQAVTEVTHRISNVRLPSGKETLLTVVVVTDEALGTSRIAYQRTGDLNN